MDMLNRNRLTDGSCSLTKEDIEMKTIESWLDEVLNNPTKMIEWLTKQYHGEATAAVRIRSFSNKYAIDEKHKKTLEVIAAQEDKHADWIGDLLWSRGIKAKIIIGKEERYWEKTIPGIHSFETGTAVAAHAEGMRLKRIRAILAHPDSPADIQKVFAKILPEEEFHERSFCAMSNHSALKATAGNHQAGFEALGLVL
jgi:rubrerythrin